MKNSAYHVERKREGQAALTADLFRKKGRSKKENKKKQNEKKGGQAVLRLLLNPQHAGPQHWTMRRKGLSPRQGKWATAPYFRNALRRMRPFGRRLPNVSPVPGEPLRQIASLLESLRTGIVSAPHHGLRPCDLTSLRPLLGRRQKASFEPSGGRKFLGCRRCERRATVSCAQGHPELL